MQWEKGIDCYISADKRFRVFKRGAFTRPWRMQDLELGVETRHQTLKSAKQAVELILTTASSGVFMDQLLTIQDLADKLQVSTRTITNWLEEKKLPRPIRIGRGLRWRPETIDNWLKKQAK